MLLVLQNGEFFQVLILKGVTGKAGDPNKKTPIWRFIPLNPRDGAEVAFPGSNHTFTYPPLYTEAIFCQGAELEKNLLWGAAGRSYNRGTRHSCRHRRSRREGGDPVRYGLR